MSDDIDLARRLGKLARDAASRAEREHDGNAGRARLVEAVALGRSGPTRAFDPRMLLVAAATMLVLAGLGIWALLPKKAVEFTVEGGAAASAGFVQAPPDHGVVVRFSDESTLALSNGSVGRVHDAKHDGARFSLERGTVAVQVTKRSGGADYAIEAGPYVVHVTGTRFDLTWDPANERMQVAMQEGSVVITGPHAEAGVGLRAGQALDVSEAGGLRIENGSALREAPASALPSSAVLPSALAPEPEREPVPAPSSSAPPHEAGEHRSSWAERVAAGDFEGVIADAEAKGIDATIDTAPLGDLMALADAARYGGRAAIASRALQAVRSRFAGTKASGTAAFLLGRMAEDSGKTDGAIGFYDATVAEGGTFAAEALGRKMMLVSRSKGRAAAAPIASEYLKRYPRGGYVDAARALVDK